MGNSKRRATMLSTLKTNPNLRGLWFGETVSAVGSQITIIALPTSRCPAPRFAVGHGNTWGLLVSPLSSHNAYLRYHSRSIEKTNNSPFSQPLQRVTFLFDSFPILQSGFLPEFILNLFIKIDSDSFRHSLNMYLVNINIYMFNNCKYKIP